MEIIVILLVVTQLLSFIFLYKLVGKVSKLESKVNGIENVEETISNNIIAMIQEFEDENQKVLTYLQQVNKKQKEVKEQFEGMEQTIKEDIEYIRKIEEKLNKKIDGMDRIGKGKEEKVSGNHEHETKSSFTYTSPFHEEVLTLEKQGYTLKEICKILNKSETEIALLLKLKQNEEI